MKSAEPNLIVIAATIFCSVVIHIVGFGGLGLIEHAPPLQSNSVAVQIVEREPVAPKPVPKPPPKPPAPKKLPETRKPDKEPVKDAQKVQGLSQHSLVAESKVSAPAGNTLMQKDEGKRLTPDEIAALERDLSSDAVLIQGSFITPEYTPPALDAYLEGRFIVDVFVDEAGRVVESELRKKIGYGMDERVLETVNSARFVPRKDPRGTPLSGWTEIAFYLEIP